MGAIASRRSHLAAMVGPFRATGRKPISCHGSGTDGLPDRHQRHFVLGPRAYANYPLHKRHTELPGEDHLFFVHEKIGDCVEEFLTGSISVAESHRVLATVLFTDIVGSTARAE